MVSFCGGFVLDPRTPPAAGEEERRKPRVAATLQYHSPPWSRALSFVAASALHLRARFPSRFPS